MLPSWCQLLRHRLDIDSSRTSLVASQWKHTQMLQRRLTDIHTNWKSWITQIAFLITFASLQYVFKIIRYIFSPATNNQILARILCGDPSCGQTCCTDRYKIVHGHIPRPQRQFGKKQPTISTVPMHHKCHTTITNFVLYSLLQKWSCYYLKHIYATFSYHRQRCTETK